MNPSNPNHYIDTACFAVPSTLTRLGNAGRNILIGPGLSNLDMSVFKNFHFPRISDGFHAQIRMEVFNTLNHANFAPPLSNRTLFAVSGAPIATAGAITATATPSRQAQFALKLIF